VPETPYEDLVFLASLVCETPMAGVTLVDDNRQWFKASRGLDVDETPREDAFCSHAIVNPDELMVVPDARVDERFADNPLVTSDPNIRFYAGAPLRTSEGHGLHCRMCFA
jgi:GAF domain-containing protein